MFVAVWPPDDVLASVAGLARPRIGGLRWTGPAQWHVTLRFFGSVDAGTFESAWLAIPLGDVGAVEAVLGPRTERFGDRVLHVPVGGLEALADVVVRSTANVGEPPDPRPFAGHLTLARARRRGIDLRPLTGVELAARWPVTEIALVRSDTRPEGASYETVAVRSL